jgi:hypothetical protein
MKKVLDWFDTREKRERFAHHLVKHDRSAADEFAPLPAYEGEPAGLDVELAIAELVRGHAKQDLEMIARYYSESIINGYSTRGYDEGESILAEYYMEHDHPSKTREAVACLIVGRREYFEGIMHALSHRIQDTTGVDFWTAYDALLDELNEYTRDRVAFYLDALK